MAKQSWKLNSLNVAKLVELRDQVEGVLHGRVSKERIQLQARLDELSAFLAPRGAVSSGTARPIKARAAKKHPLKGRKAPVKYRGPNGETWSGRGLPPRWLSALEAKGKKRERFLIKRAG